jgi:hypothetical protein
MGWVVMMHKHYHFILSYMHNTCSWLRCIVLVAMQQCWSKTLEALSLANDYATIFVILVGDFIDVKRLIEIHNKRTKGQNFTINFEVC